MTNVTPLEQLANFSEEEILAAAEQIHLNRLKRQGSITDPAAAGSFFRMRLAGLEHEEFHVMFLDTRHRIITVEMLSRGTIDGAEVHPREVVKMALKLNAAAVLVAHNHPSGSPEPSAADRAVTAQLKAALTLVDVRLLDHLVVVGDTSVSLAMRGWL